MSGENQVISGSSGNDQTSRINGLVEHLNMKAWTVTNSYIQSPSIIYWRATKELTYVENFKCQFWEKEQYLFFKSQGFERADWTLKITSFNPTILGHKILSFWESLKYVFCHDWQFHPEVGRLSLPNLQSMIPGPSCWLESGRWFWLQRFYGDFMGVTLWTFCWQNQYVGDFLLCKI